MPDEVDWIAVEQLVSAGVIEKNGHEISDFGATAFYQRQASKPRFDAYCSDLSQFILPPVRKNPAVKIGSVSLFGGIAAPRVVFCQFTLLEMIVKLRDRN